MRKLLLALVCCSVIGIFPASAAEKVCGSRPTNRELHTELADTLQMCERWQPCWQEAYSKLVEAVRRDPQDPALTTLMLNSSWGKGVVYADKLRMDLLDAAKRNPGNADAQYAAGLAAPRKGPSLEYFARTLKLNPNYAVAHLQIAELVLNPAPVLNQTDLIATYGSPEANLQKYIDSCPDQPISILGLHRVGDRKFWDSNNKNFRYLLDRYERPYNMGRYVAGLSSLWALEARVYPERAKEFLWLDLFWLNHLEQQNLSSEDALANLDGRASAYNALDFPLKKEALQDEIAERFPCVTAYSGTDNFPIYSRVTRFHRDHGGRRAVIAMDADAALDYIKLWEPMIKACPGIAPMIRTEMIMPAVYRRFFLGADTSMSPEEQERFFVGEKAKLGKDYQGRYFEERPEYFFLFRRILNGSPVTENDAAMLRVLIKDAKLETSSPINRGWNEDQLPHERRQYGLDLRMISMISVLAQVEALLGKPEEGRALLDDPGFQALLRDADDLFMDPEFGATYLRRFLSPYWIARALTAESPWDSFGYARLAKALAEKDQTKLDYDPRLDPLLATLSQSLGIDGSVEEWKGSEAGKVAFDRSLGVIPEAKLIWKKIDPPIPLPPFVLPLTSDKDGIKMLSSDTLGAITVIDIWATWCPPCQAELHHLLRVAKETPVVLLGVDDEVYKARPFLNDQGLLDGFPNAVNGEQYFRSLYTGAVTKNAVILAVPQNLLVVRNPVTGVLEIRVVVSGFDARLSQAQIDQWVSDMIAFAKSGGTVIPENE